MSARADERWMLVALLEGRKAQGKSYPNPPVGAALVKDGRLLSTGHTQARGGPHAEVSCLRRSHESPEGATLYVTLEPCSHTGKSGKCTEVILRSSVDRVVVGIQDPNPRVAGSGVHRLKQDGIQVDIGILQELCSSDLEEYLWRAKNGLERGFSARSEDCWEEHSALWLDHLSNDAWAQSFIHSDSLRIELGDLSGLNVLDFGGGSGDISAALCALGASVTYTDQSRSLLNAAVQRNAGNSHFSAISAAEFKSEDPIPKYDLIVASMVLHDIENLELLLANLRPRLKSGARFYATILHPCFKSSHSRWINGHSGDILHGQLVDRYGNHGVNMQAINGGGPSGIPTLNIHRRLSCYLNSLIKCGLSIEQVFEPDGRQHPEYCSTTLKNSDHWFRKSPVFGVVCRAH
jgi:pyrimidine deaminase RibD-like protein/2-polyprenyl-3-methyl-5-hydroxy-6-metoxy-1,4-benzoquinol methylase